MRKLPPPKLHDNPQSTGAGALVLSDRPLSLNYRPSVGELLRSPLSRLILQEPQADGSQLVLFPDEHDVRRFPNEAAATAAIRAFRSQRAAWFDVRALPGDIDTAHAPHPWRAR